MTIAILYRWYSSSLFPTPARRFKFGLFNIYMLMILTLFIIKGVLLLKRHRVLLKKQCYEHYQNGDIITKITNIHCFHYRRWCHASYKIIWCSRILYIAGKRLLNTPRAKLHYRCRRRCLPGALIYYFTRAAIRPYTSQHARLISTPG